MISFQYWYGKLAKSIYKSTALELIKIGLIIKFIKKQRI